MVILAHIREQHRLSLGSYGRPRMTAEFNELGVSVGQRRVGRLMRENGIRVHRSQASSSAPPTVITPSAPRRISCEPRLHREPPEPEMGGRHLPHIWTREGWAYLAVILDFLSRRVVGWVASQPHEAGSGAAGTEPGHRPAQAVARLHSSYGHHTDRGAQYCAHGYQKLLRQHGLEVSMSGTGNCYDNSVAESFLKSLQAELIWRHSWQTRREVELALFEYINGLSQSAPQTLDPRLEITRGFEQKAA